ncbi:hypothetical protein [Rubricoccus marinus]|uniref:Tetratricopeptide repeat protein n=1 Tax=Rubricoccus marinus TaxID=716817 RepID=A0A259TZK6_9BACT|nr:hypothetical protein [Rubricoccus marinus]OZC02994.1 hypothetical protein BSZ36_08425 [Rubricoccus marinus]
MRRFAFLALLLAAPLAAQQFTRTPGATEKYHTAAQAHIAGETDRAIQEAEAGLALDPDNAKLKRLLDLLRQQKPPQDGDDGQQDENSESGDEGDKQQDPGDNGQPEQDDQAKRDGTDQDQNKPQDQQDGANGSRPNTPPRNQPGASGDQRGAQMSQAEAQRLLDAVGAEEELLVSKMRRPTRQRRSERDW